MYKNNFDFIEKIDENTKVFLLRDVRIYYPITVTVHFNAEQTHFALNPGYTADIWIAADVQDIKAALRDKVELIVLHCIPSLWA